MKGKGFIGRSGLQTSGQMGNTEKFTSQFSTIGAFRLDQNEWLYSGNYKYGTSAKTKDTNLGIAHLRHTWGYLNPIAYELFLQSEFNEFKELNSRNYFGGNVRFRLLLTDNYHLFLGTGIFYEREDFVTREDRDHLRGNFYLSYVHNLNQMVSGFATLYYQPMFSEMNNYRVRLQTGLDVKLSEKLSLSMSFNVSNDTGLPPGVKETDVDYLVGFSLSY